MMTPKTHSTNEDIRATIQQMAADIQELKQNRQFSTPPIAPRETIFISIIRRLMPLMSMPLMSDVRISRMSIVLTMTIGWRGIISLIMTSKVVLRCDTVEQQG
jgi:hypothetical protein